MVIQNPNGSNGDKDPRNGRFLPGNKAAKGNKFAIKVHELRVTLLNAVTPEDMRQIVRTLVSKAKAGDIAAAREILLRTLGKPTESDLLERMEAAEEVLEQVMESKR